MKTRFLYVALLALAACAGKVEKTKQADPLPAPLAKSANSNGFNQSFEKLLSNYYALKDGFIGEKDSLIQLQAHNLLLSVDSLKLHELKGDPGIAATAKTYTTSIADELKGLTGEKELEAKRRSFQMVGQQLYDLIRTVQYDRAIVYHEFCPMAFNEQGADWLSNSADIRNPYLPKKMLTCGEVKDSIDFRKKL